MKKWLTIAFGVVLVILNILLTVLLWKQNEFIVQLKKQNESLKSEQNQLIEMSEFVEDINTHNLNGTYQPIVFNNKKLYDTINDIAVTPKLCIRYNINTCPPCVNELNVFAKKMAQEIGVENIIILLISKNSKDIYTVKNTFGNDFEVIQIESNDLYVQTTERVATPYLFVYNKMNKYPFLFSFFHAEMKDLNRRYFQVLSTYFKTKAYE